MSRESLSIVPSVLEHVSFALNKESLPDKTDLHEILFEYGLFSLRVERREVKDATFDVLFIDFPNDKGPKNAGETLYLVNSTKAIAFDRVHESAHPSIVSRVARAALGAFEKDDTKTWEDTLRSSI